MSSAEQALSYQEIYKDLGYVPLDFGARVRQARRYPLKGRPMTQAELEKAAGLNVGMVGAWEAQGVEPRRIHQVAQRIADVTGYSVLWLLGLVGEAGIEPARPSDKGLLSLINGSRDDDPEAPELPLRPSLSVISPG